MTFEEHYRNDFERMESCNSKWLASSRKAALKRFLELGFPDNKIEEWKYTNIKKMANKRYKICTTEEKIKIVNFTEYEPRIVLVNGVLCNEISILPVGVEIMPLVEAVERKIVKTDTFEDRRMDADAFWAMNTAFAGSGLYLRVPDGVKIDVPILIMNVTVSRAEPIICHPRNMIVVGKRGSLSIIEHYTNFGEGDTLSNSVTQIYTDEEGCVEHIMKTNMSSKGIHIGNVNAYQKENSRIKTHNFCMGGKAVRNSLNFSLKGTGSYCQMNGLYIVNDGEHVDNHTTVEHLVPHCDSKEHYKGIIDGKGSAVFNGKIRVHENAQKTDAIQNNENLLLSDDAVIHTKPELEIYADDVKCTHGATIGQIDEDAVFYLRCRGIDKKEARKIMIKAYVGEIIEGVENSVVRNMLEKEVMTCLSAGAA